ncbi:unnamed protein product [Prunus armeniaca]
MIVPVAIALTVGLLGWAYQALKPPPPKICGSPGGPPVTSPRVKLSDGRHLAYREFGVPKEEAKHKIIVVHGFDSSRDLSLPIPQELVEEYRIYFLFFDRAGYGESDPYPSRSVKSEAFDIQELADKLQIGSKFYVIGISMGAYPVWGCLKYIPHRLCGASLVVPFVHYWWPCVPANISRESLSTLPVSDQRAFRVAHYAPWLFHWWMTQKFFPSLSVLCGNTSVFSRTDLEMLKKLSEAPSVGQVYSKFPQYQIGRFLFASCNYIWRFWNLLMSNFVVLGLFKLKWNVSQQLLYIPTHHTSHTYISGSEFIAYEVKLPVGGWSVLGTLFW